MEEIIRIKGKLQINDGWDIKLEREGEHVYKTEAIQNFEKGCVTRDRYKREEIIPKPKHWWNNKYRSFRFEQTYYYIKVGIGTGQQLKKTIPPHQEATSWNIDGFADSYRWVEGYTQYYTDIDYKKFYYNSKEERDLAFEELIESIAKN